MSKLNLTEFEDSLFTPTIVGGIVDKFLELTKKMPDALVVTDEQWSKHFFQANEKLTNFRGIPLETPDRADTRTIVQRTINGILTGMHIGNVTEVSDVYRMLEEMKAKIIGDTHE